MRKLLCGFILLSPLFCLGQTSFAPFQYIQAEIAQPTDLKAGDLDGDGDLDLLALGYFSQDIHLYENEVTDFAPGRVVSTGLTAYRYMALGDVDGDLDLDILIANTEGHHLEILENLGGLVFDAPAAIASTPRDFEDFELADIDGDGDLDIIALSDYWAGTFTNDGTGNFANESTLADTPLSSPFFGVVAGDINNDAALDLFLISSASGDSHLQSYLNDGSGGFTPSFSHTGTGGYGSGSLTDVNGDGYADLILGATSGGLRWHENLADDTFADQVHIDYIEGGWGKINVLDYDGDGDQDIIGSFGWADEEIGIQRNDGVGNFTFEYLTYDDSDCMSSLVTADFNQDGYNDVINAEHCSDNISILHGVLPGELGSLKTLNTYVTSEMQAGDVDMDGDIDIVCFGGSPQSGMVWYSNLGNGEFEIHSIAYLEDFWKIGDMADFDQNGAMDLVVPEYDYPGPTTLHRYEYVGDDEFTHHPTIATIDDNVESLDLADWDQDGWDDLIVHTQDFGLSIFPNLGDGQFGDPISMVLPPLIGNGTYGSEETWAMRIQSADMDGDGDNDLLVSQIRPDFLAWIENNGDMTFDIIHPISTITVDNIAIGDVDGDDDLDIMAGGISSGTYYLHLNDGAGNFSPDQLISRPVNGLSSVACGDMDGDGIDDAIFYAASRSGSQAPAQFFVGWQESLPAYGCTDPTACNYDEASTGDDGSCCFGICGCMREGAANYNSDAECDDGSCVFEFTGRVFYDSNENGDYEEGEPPMPNHMVTVEPAGMTLFTNPEGEFALTTTIPYNVVVAEDNPAYPYFTDMHPQETIPHNWWSWMPDIQTHFDIGITEQVPHFDLGMYLYREDNWLCNAWLDYTIGVKNTGNVELDGYVKFHFDSLFQDYEIVTPVDSIVGDTLYYGYESLSPGEIYWMDVQLYSPTVDFLGAEYMLQAEGFGFYADQGLVATGERTILDDLECAYDPNDKQAEPQGYNEDHLLLSDTRQEFLVRFQNTGNAPAQDVVIRDTLDANYDITSFELLTNSHPMAASLNNNTGELVFEFLDIQLPDSVCCEPESHGFVSYAIRSKPNLDAGTRLENTAYIYFDNNEAIVTNTTWTTIHQCKEALTLEYGAAEDCLGDHLAFSSDYDSAGDWEQDFQWFNDADLLGTAEALVLYPSDPLVETIYFQADNPLCSEMGTVQVDFTPLNLDPTCPGDFDCNGVVGSPDMLILLGAFGCEGLTCRYDLTSDSAINTADYLELLAQFGLTCP